MGLPRRRCANCRHFFHGSPRERDFWPIQHGHCYKQFADDQSGEHQAKPPYPAHANSRGCKMYEELYTCGMCSKFIPRHTGNGGVVYGMCPLGLLGKSTTSQMAGCPDWIEKDSARLTAEAVDSGSNDSAVENEKATGSSMALGYITTPHYPATFIVTKDTVLWHTQLNIDPLIREHFTLKPGMEDLVVCNLIPPEDNYDLPLHYWAFRTQPITVDMWMQTGYPNWFIWHDAERRCRLAAIDWWALWRLKRNV